MSSGAKRPPQEVVYQSGGSSSCKAKRRKQATPVRISGDAGPGESEPSVPSMPSLTSLPSLHSLPGLPTSTPPTHSPSSPADRIFSPGAAEIDDYRRYGEVISNQDKENYADPYRNSDNRLPMPSFKYRRYGERFSDEDVECGDAALVVRRINEKSDENPDGITYGIKDGQNDTEGVNMFRLNVDERLRDVEAYRKLEKRDGFDNGERPLINLPEDPENMGRHSCGKCGIIFPSLELLKLHFESEHMEKDGRTSQTVECKIEPFDNEETSPGSGPQSLPPTDPRVDVWSAEFQAKMADIYKNAMTFPHDMSKESTAPNFNTLCPPFSLFPTAVPPQRPLMEPIRIFNPEAYCELCSKEFCNKYFLKTHKANKHGIYENIPSNSSAENINLEPSMIPGTLTSSNLKFKNNMMLAEYAKSYEAALLASQRHKVKIQRMMEEAQVNSEGPTATGLNMSMNSRQLNVEDIRSSSDDNTIPENFIFKGDIRHEQDEPFMTPTPRKLSPDSSKRARESGFNTDTLRRLGVINPEAFCKICCKEYCNKYFLKTHKIKRHGLLPSPTEKYPQKEIQNTISDLSDQKEGQTSPLNLIIGEENQDKLHESPEIIVTPKPMKNVPHQNNQRPLSTQSVDSSSIDDKRDNSNEAVMRNDNIKQSPTTIFISEDLQKLQTMISQLNDLSVNKIVECYICKKEFENNYILQFHMMSDHGVSVSNSVEAFTFPSGSNEDIHLETQQQQKTNCTICEKEFSSLLLLKKHVDEYHSQKNNLNESKPSNDCIISDKEANIQRERRASMSLTPTNSYCEICNKELCNKYFMKTHMQRMHGIEIENGTQIGGVICDICNKELCSKYFLRVHKHNTHGIVEPGAPLPQMRNMSNEQENSFNSPPAPTTLKPPPEPSILSNRFIAHFVEVCPFCSRRFRTSKWLKAHLMSDHGKAGVEKWKELEVHYKAQAKVQSNKNSKQGATLTIPDSNTNTQPLQNSNIDIQERLPFYSKLNEPKILNLFGMNNPEMKTYNCSYCPFSTSILSFLYVHEKSHAQGNEMDILCPMCPESFTKPEALQIHIITTHSLPEWKERPGLDASPNSNRECQNTQIKTPPSDNGDDKSQIQTSNGNGKAEIFDCYECDFKSCNFGAMEMHLKNQHCAVKDGNFDPLPDNECENFNNDLRKVKIPTIYAVPRNLDAGIEGGETSITMQPFMIEENTSEIGGGKFVPSVVFLPVRRRTTGMITISFNLTPA